MPKGSNRNRPDRARPESERASKTCARCGRPFSWRKKWARDWEQVRYCSDRCRMGQGTGNATRTST
ncbi:MAG: DUF2256 domain-containing protein [Gemmatimonadota bacterium]